MTNKTEPWKYQHYVQRHLELRDMLEGLAEEANELSQAALKLIRAIGDSKNVTPISEEEAEANLKEEVTDVLIYLRVLDFDLGLELDSSYHSPKWERWAKRLGYKED